MICISVVQVILLVKFWFLVEGLLKELVKSTADYRVQKLDMIYINHAYVMSICKNTVRVLNYAKQVSLHSFVLNETNSAGGSIQLCVAIWMHCLLRKPIRNIPLSMKVQCMPAVTTAIRNIIACEN